MGEVFAGRFELLEPIADGGMGSVWVVRDRRDDQVYAGKVLRQSDSASLVRFMREQATRISHDHVVTPLSWAGEDDRVLFTMPLVRGGSVATLIGDHGALPASWTRELLLQLLTALEAVHATGVVHRDVKPANLLLHATGTARPHLLLTDFGISARLDDPRLTHASQVIGSPGYMAPEQASGADPAVTQDVYAAGMVGLEMLTGVRPPRTRDAVPAVLAAQPSLEPLASLLLEAVRTESTARPPSAAALRERLVALDLSGTPAPEEPVVVLDQLEGVVSAPTRVRPRPTAEDRTEAGGDTPVPDRRRLAVLLLVVAAACLAGAAWLLLA
ncbi:serine/threonine-protein kinase [Nocardioides flavus (ex Wang et al. 2016)]|uniref:serine/threonine-protein kinase n=1 Tax=Nocardioides flavus (ex Wang et al. 2016) TaxID=2058780 RepID=UPI00174AA148|nr:serine/threonine-protein kinase [Nocardioides flavus (ex Wang et al. 2016)]